MKNTYNRNNIKTVFLDIDGVIIGTRHGDNFPQPNIVVQEKLKKIKGSGIKVTLCTAKAFFCVKNTIDICELNAYHITDGGAVIYNPFTGEKHITPMEKAISQQVVKELEAANLYTEAYTIDNYFITKSDLEITEKHTEVLGIDPQIVKDLNTIIGKEEVIKIMLIARNAEEEATINEIGKKYTESLSLSWGVHPTMLPMQVAWFTAKGINKKSALEKVMALENSAPENSLAVGDSTGDWNFMQVCKYVATLENGTADLKKFIKARGTDGCLAPSVEENGILFIFNTFRI
jgi:HAD superfamily hydrolase (TIGR01484 family)